MDIEIVKYFNLYRVIKLLLNNESFNNVWIQVIT